jgi:uncharacterized membrane protein
MRRSASLALVLGILAATLVVGVALRAPCASGDWSDGRQYRHLCYTDLIPLYGTEHLDGSRLPYLDACPPAAGQCDEYPVLTMYAMRLAATVGPEGAGGFYATNVLLLAMCAAVIALLLFQLGGSRALFFAAAPTLAIYAFINWDLIAVAFATGATYALLRRRSGWAGVLIGLGTAAKLYPVLLLVPFALGMLHERRRRDAVRMLVGAAGAWLVVNLPFAVKAPEGWSQFFRFNSARPPDWDSMWFVGCHIRSGQLSCLSDSVPLVNVVSASAFVLLSLLVWRLKVRRSPDFPRWTFAFPLLVLFLLTNKVYSPQYSLWLLPWFALALPDLRFFAAFEAADVAVFATRFLFFADLTGMHDGLPFWPFEVALLVRAVVLACCVGAWIIRRAPAIDGLEPPDLDAPPAGAPAVPA